MGILRGKLQTVREMGGDIKIVNLNKHIQTIFETIGLDEIFEIYKNEEEALKKFQIKWSEGVVYEFIDIFRLTYISLSFSLCNIF